MTLAYQLFSLPDSSDWITFSLGLLITILITLYVYFLRPHLEIGVPEISSVDNQSIVVPIKNLGKKRKVVRIKTEIAVVLNDFSYTFKVLEDDFAFLHPLDIRMFKAYDVNDYLLTLPNNNINNYTAVFNILSQEEAFLRVKVHASDSFSGMGECFENTFKYQRNSFVKIN